MVTVVTVSQVPYHATDDPPKPAPGQSTAIFLAVGGPLDHVQLPKMVLQTIYHTISGRPLPQMVPHATVIHVILDEHHEGTE